VATALERVEGRYALTRTHVDVRARIPDLGADAFAELVARARRECFVTRALSRIPMSFDAALEPGPQDG
jgi:organic hydroperoxide reductase OsmC/OhrA